MLRPAQRGARFRGRACERRRRRTEHRGVRPDHRAVAGCVHLLRPLGSARRRGPDQVPSDTALGIVATTLALRVRVGLLPILGASPRAEWRVLWRSSPCMCSDLIERHDGRQSAERLERHAPSSLIVPAEPLEVLDGKVVPLIVAHPRPCTSAVEQDGAIGQHLGCLVGRATPSTHSSKPTSPS